MIPEFCNKFVNKPTIAFKRNKKTQNLLGGHVIKDGKVAKKKFEKLQGKRKTLCCMQVVITNNGKVTKQKQFSTYAIPLHAEADGLSTYKNVFYVIFTGTISFFSFFSENQ